jgi:glutamate formiminotransferase/formiminotetrahydrofolate cyclodeaminase
MMRIYDFSYFTAMKHFDENDKLVECVPNFSEGRDRSVIEAIAAAIDSVDGAHVLHCDMGYDAHRTVVSFAARAEALVEAAFRAIETASRLIDMSVHQGAHPRMGATDVCPFIPLQHISMDEVIPLSNELGRRVGEELNIPVYLYEFSARHPSRKRLSDIRRGGYEAMPHKMELEAWQPDYGMRYFNKRSGMTAIGARNFLVAFNVNIDTEDVRVATKIARRVRESGYYENGVHFPGRIKGLKAIGWHMPSLHCAQVSMNITDIDKAGIERVFEAVKEEAASTGHAVTGAELIGLIPSRVLEKAGMFYRSTAFHEDNVLNDIDLAIKYLNINLSTDDSGYGRILENLL